MKNGLIWFCRIAVGLLFIFSGLIKANDPLGFSYKLVEYFEVFHITFLNDLALTTAILLCALEMILGFALLIGVRPVKVAWGLLLLIIFFGFLTFYSAFFKVVQTCGCFGDAIPLTPWQSFSKDMVLLVLVAVLFVNRTKIKPLFSAKAGDKWLIGAAVVAIGFGLYTYNFMPVVDFLPYKIGANIPDEMKTPPGAPLDVFELTYHLKNKKTGETKVMNDKIYLSSNIWKDANWEVIGDPENKLIKKGFEPKIRDLAIQDAQRNDYTKELLASPYYSLIIVAYDLDKTNGEAINRLNALAINAVENYNIRTILLTSNSAASAQAFAKAHKLVSEIFYADGVPLKTMIRSNPGVILLKNGIIINKWHYHSVPKYDDLAKTYFQHQ
ncbi:BT_3928 family protein [Mucilaginibacter sp. FT3.2]|uniref:BT_3928 family protein n=1 Tax=Mucilaginibacter sp. FT3.2 TaxID=2723090 RepID=UPI00161DC834|nr:BT_3928 family protein [Mucilaginibacter sp. FT3.2]MBB6230576.1 putative membrane protein YphA (DoxX/SURF4 family) [Mucilaginibacter sp. FT3.2]